MKPDFGAAMREAFELTRAQKLTEATRVIQRALTGRGSVAFDVQRPIESARLPGAALPESEIRSGTVEPPHRHASAQSGHGQDAAAEEPLPARPRRPLGQVLRLLREADLLGLGLRAAPAAKLRKAPTVRAPDGATYQTRTFACAAGSRDYSLYIPSHARGRTPPLIVMLHGCTQDPGEFAVGTGMNLLAEEHGFIVAYPRQPASANSSACWNWFNPKDQMRDAGEPSIIAGITREIIAEFGIDGGPRLRRRPFGRRRHGRDHERHISRALRRGRRSLGSRLRFRRRPAFGFCCDARRREPHAAEAPGQTTQRRRSHDRFSWRERQDRRSVECRGDPGRHPRRPLRSGAGNPARRRRGRTSIHTHCHRRRERRSSRGTLGDRGIGACLVGRRSGRIVHRSPWTRRLA